MSTDKMREEFEAEYLKDVFVRFSEAGVRIDQWLARGSNGEYRSHRAAGAWWGWKASREELVIELPAQLEPADPQPCDWQNGGAEMRARCWNAIEATGLKVKS